MKNQYVYAAARIHSMEGSMLNSNDIKRILSAPSFENALEALTEKGYDCKTMTTIDDLIDRERKKTYKLISDLVEDMSVFDVFFYKTDFQNLKASIKSGANDAYVEDILAEGGTVPPKIIAEAVKNCEFHRLPEFLKFTAENVKRIFLETGDTALCDRLIDKACLEAILKKGKMSDCELIRDYAELLVALSDIKIALRGTIIGKKAEFFRQSLADCSSISVYMLEKSASNGEKDVLEYIKLTEYSPAVEAWKKGCEAFEKWCDDKIMDRLKKDKFNYFTLAPVAAYIPAKNIELKMVRAALLAVKNRLENSKIKERLRILYV